MDLSRLMVYYLDSLPGNWSKYPSMKKTVDAAILKFRSKKNYRNRKDITWVRVQCPQQNNSIDCGFFVLRFMRDIIALNRIDIPKMADKMESGGAVVGQVILDGSRSQSPYNDNTLRMGLKYLLKKRSLKR
ncbi:hypothetical protein KIW84_014949 [Lathyrus oleraceus]|uniref:Ubiquitin-like protease family profile domain-containing protein n=1 Tax=Pisum sativum TaxID=3888 RepID=A0A9D5GZY0_PEA|nr:hypothetical protein KIW84_014949 [Pisum sativum]